MSSTIVSVLLFWALFFGSSNSSPAPIGSSSSFSRRSILRDINKNEKRGDYGVELNVTNFDVVLRDTPHTFAIVEFFANW